MTVYKCPTQHWRSFRSSQNHVLGIGEGLTEFQFWLYVSMVIFLTLIAGLMSGLTLGLMSIDSVELEVRLL